MTDHWCRHVPYADVGQAHDDEHAMYLAWVDETPAHDALWWDTEESRAAQPELAAQDQRLRARAAAEHALKGSGEQGLPPRMSHTDAPAFVHEW